SIHCGYDDLNRLTAETSTGAGVNYTLAYQYDLAGNRTQKTLNGQSTIYDIDNNDRIMHEHPPGGGTIDYTYDDGGFLTDKISSGGGLAENYVADAEGRLASYSKTGPQGGTAMFLYDHNG